MDIDSREEDERYQQISPDLGLSKEQAYHGRSAVENQGFLCLGAAVAVLPSSVAGLRNGGWLSLPSWKHKK